jgi:hypothetical protein
LAQPTVNVSNVVLSDISGELGLVPLEVCGQGTCPRAVGRFRCTPDFPCRGITLQRFNVTGFRASSAYPYACSWTFVTGSATNVHPYECVPPSPTRLVAQTPVEVVSFGVITDVHYADADAAGTRFYRDSLPKVKAAMIDLAGRGTDFLAELGDFKDTDASQCGHGLATQACTNLTLGFLDTIEAEMAKFLGPRFHLLGNHDVDVLNQSAVLTRVQNAPVTTGGPGYYSFSFPFPVPFVGEDTDGCLVRSESGSPAYVWIVHTDGTRNWLSFISEGAWNASHPVHNIEVYRKRHDGRGSYTLNASASVAAFLQRCANCVCGEDGVPAELPSPAPPLSAPLRFIALNGDYTDGDVAWEDLDGGATAGAAWNDANVPTTQMEWLAEQLQQADAAAQRVIVFIHYRLDGGPGGPVGMGLGPSVVPDRSWVDDCTLSNAAVVRSLLESRPGLVLATFSGHDHAPQPPYTHQAIGKPAYVTFAAMVEGTWPSHNAYSRVSVLTDCSIRIHGFGSGGYDATIPGPDDCVLVPRDSRGAEPKPEPEG